MALVSGAAAARGGCALPPSLSPRPVGRARGERCHREARLGRERSAAALGEQGVPVRGFCWPSNGPGRVAAAITGPPEGRRGD